MLFRSFGYGEEQHTITVDLTQEAVEELEATGVIQPSNRARGVASPRLAAAVREEDLLARETQLAERERQIAEQQRVINEEYRLLKLRAEHGAADQPSGTEWSWPPAAARPSEVVAAAAPPQLTVRRDPSPIVLREQPASIQPQRIVMPKREAPVMQPPPAPPTVWTRLRRSLFGDVKPLFED